MVSFMAGNVGNEFADDDPEYATDAAAEVDAEAAEFDTDDSKKMPKDLGDLGQAGPPGGDD
jgi:hypothetical protein